jgi:exopolysaccharide production protein ExoZ
MQSSSPPTIATSIPVQKSDPTLYGLQALRFLAAAMVVVTHVLNRTVTAYPDGGVPDHQFLEAGVDIFFVISGFIMVHIIRPDTKPGAFWLQRFTRIAPLYWVATIIAFFGGLLAPHYFYGTQSVLFTLKSMFFIPTGSDMWAHPIVQQGWTLVYEFLFYTILALCLFLKRPFLPAALVLVLIMTAGLLLGKSVGVLGFYSDQAMLLEFMLGMGLAAALKGQTLPAWVGLLLMAGGLTLVYLMWNAAVPYPRGLKVGLPATLVVAGTLVSEPVWRSRPWLKRAALLGDASYAIYIAHYFFVAAIGRGLQDFPAPKGWLGPWGYSIIMGVVALGAGFLAHLWVEKPLLRVVRGWLPGRGGAWVKGPLTRPAADLSPEGRGEKEARPSPS